MRTAMTLLLCAGLGLWPLGTRAGAQNRLRTQVESYVDSHQQEIVRELADLLAIPDVAADRENIRRKALRLQTLFSARGFEARLLETDGNPLVYAQFQVSGATQTLLLYCHYDGQPVDPSSWRQDDPFVPILRAGKMEDDPSSLGDPRKRERYEPDWRIYARSASDDTSPIVGLLAAFDALKAAGRAPTSNLRVILDGEEEAGSSSLVSAIGRYKDLLAADLMVILDGPVHQSNRPTVVFGARGIQTVQLTVYGPRFSLHSGHYGNWVPNPAQRLARLLASMKGDDGRVTLDGFYDGITIPDQELAIMRQVPDDEAGLLELFGIAEPDRVGPSLQEARNYPSLNVRGMRSGWVEDDVRTIVPDLAIAEIDIRLILETPPEVMRDKLRAHLQKEGYHVTETEPTVQERARYPRLVRMVARDGTRAYRTSMSNPLASRLVAALEEMWDQPPVRLRTSGGTVPISPFIEALGFPAVNLPTVNFDNNQHSPDENLRLGHFFAGINSIAALLAM